jgi:hypothetical protein
MLPFILGLRECLPTGSADGSLLVLILNVDVNVVAMTFVIPGVSTVFSIEHDILTVGVVWVARLGEVGDGREIRVTNGANSGGVSLPSSPRVERCWLTI